MPSRLRTFVTLSLAVAASTTTVQAQERVDGAIQKRGGFFGQARELDEIEIVHGSEFKGARKVAISVFNVAFPTSNQFTATTTGKQFWGRTTSAAQTSLSTSMTGVDDATRQRIADKAHALFVAQLAAAGYEVVDQAELARAAPEFARWESVPNFTPGRYGAYVVPTGQSLRFLPGDQGKRDTSGVFTGQFASIGRTLDNPQAFSRSPYIARDAALGVIAVTLVVDYGVYSSSGEGRRFGGGASVGFKPGVTVAAGNNADRASFAMYWGPNSGGFPAYAHLQKPVFVDRPFWTGSDDSSSADSALVADPGAFEAAADDAIAVAVPKLVGAMAAAR